MNRKAVSPISKTFGTQAEAVAWREETLARVRQERADAKAEAQAEPAVRHTVASWAAVWLARLERSRYLAPSTRRSYAAQLTNHVLPVLGAVALDELRPWQLTELYADLTTRQFSPLSRPSTVHVHNVVRQLLKAAVGEWLITGNPADGAEIPRRTGPAAEVQVFSPRQVLAFLADPRVQAHPYFGVYPVAFDTGLRRGELLGLTPDDLHLDAAVPYLRVRRHLHQDGSTDEPKTNAAKRRVTLPTAATAAVLREALARRADPARPAHAPQLWLDHRGSPLSPGAVGKAFVRLVGAFVRSPAGVECGAPMITLHGTRHSFYVNCRAAGTSASTASRLLGHTSEVFSQITYGHLTDEEGDTLVALYERDAA